MLIISKIIKNINLGINRASLPPMGRSLFKRDDLKLSISKTKPETFNRAPKIDVIKLDVNNKPIPPITNTMPAKKTNAGFQPKVLFISFIKTPLNHIIILILYKIFLILVKDIKSG